MSSRIEFTAQGPLAPDTDEVRAAVLAYWQEAFNNQLNPDMATPQGQLITSETAVIQDKNNQLLFLAQQFDPINAAGRFQDALAAIYFIERHPAMPTVVQCECMGLEGVVIPGADTSNEPAIVRDGNGNEFYCQRTTTIPKSGVATVPFAAKENGPLEVEANGVSTIVTAINGWDTVINPKAGATGQDVENRRAFELRRQMSVAMNSRSMLESVYARVGAMSGVLSLLARQNRGDAPKTERGVSMGPHSVYIAVVGGADADIAKAIYDSVSAGCDYNGNTSYEVKDPVTGAVEMVRFQRPSALRIKVNVRVKGNDRTPADIAEKIRANIMADFNGEEYPNPDKTTHAPASQKVSIGDDIFASRFYCPTISAGATDVLGITLQIGNGAEVNVIELLWNQYATLATQDVLVFVEY